MEISKGGEFNIEPTKKENKQKETENNQNTQNNNSQNINFNKNLNEYPFQIMNPYMIQYMNPYYPQYLFNRNIPYMNYMMYPNLINNNIYRRGNNVFPGMMPTVGNFPMQNIKMNNDKNITVNQNNQKDDNEENKK